MESLHVRFHRACCSPVLHFFDISEMDLVRCPMRQLLRIFLFDWSRTVNKYDIAKSFSQDIQKYDRPFWKSLFVLFSCSEILFSSICKLVFVLSLFLKYLFNIYLLPRIAQNRKCTWVLSVKLLSIWFPVTISRDPWWSRECDIYCYIVRF